MEFKFSEVTASTHVKEACVEQSLIVPVPNGLMLYDTGYEKLKQHGRCVRRQAWNLTTLKISDFAIVILAS